MLGEYIDYIERCCAAIFQANLHSKMIKNQTSYHTSTVTLYTKNGCLQSARKIKINLIISSQILCNYQYTSRVVLNLINNYYCKRGGDIDWKILSTEIIHNCRYGIKSVDGHARGSECPRRIPGVNAISGEMLFNIGEKYSSNCVSCDLNIHTKKM